MKNDETIALIVIVALIGAVLLGAFAGHYAGYQAGIAYQMSNPANNLPECEFSMVINFQGMDHSGYYISTKETRCVINLTKET